MYKAKKLYPIYKYREHLYMTDGVKRRLEEFRLAVRNCHSMSAAALKYCLQVTVVRSFINNCQGVTLDTWCRLHDSMRWDLSRDVNWSYAQVKHTPEDIQRRVIRLLGKSSSPAVLLTEAMNLADERKVYATITYGEFRTCKYYGHIMTWLGRQEKLRGYDDALDFEE